MAIITISRGSFSHGKKIAEEVAKRLNYKIISREVILEASKDFNVPEAKLLNAIANPISFFERFSYKREKYIAYIEAEILKHLKEDNIIYHGFAGHFFVKDIPHAFKIRIIANLDERIKLVMKEKNISEEEARKFIEELDEARRKWSLQLYGIDTNDPSLYDMVIHIDKLKIENAVNIICDVVKSGIFDATPESQQIIEDKALAAELKAILVDFKPDVEVSCKKGVVTIKTTYPVQLDDSTLAEKIRERCMKNPKVKEVKVEILPFTIYER